MVGTIENGTQLKFQSRIQFTIISSEIQSSSVSQVSQRDSSNCALTFGGSLRIQLKDQPEK
ncbi:TPA: hypothetical protein DIC40_06745 [Patescibacteria group bacterium]|nr:hypothetical protein [Candidatus Gracilibacteria bacterium]